MSVRLCLKIARQRILEGVRGSVLSPGRDLFTAVRKSAESRAEEAEALDQLERIACPAFAAMQAAVVKWGQTEDNADGRRAVELAKVRGATETLDAWVFAEGRTKDELVRLLNTAILKS